MKAFIINKYGKNEKMSLTNIADPKLGEHDVLVQIHAASVNLIDSKIKNGEFKLFLPYKTPFVLGHDVAGVVTKIGEGVKNFKVGDEVYSRPSDMHIGTFAEYISINEKDVALKPKNISMAEAASIPLVGLTAWQALVEKANIKKGHKVFIQAGSGGVGTFAIQLAKYFGASVATTTSTSNVDFVKSFGADIIVDYKNEDFVDRLNNYDVVLNSQDSGTLIKSLSVLKSEGKIISISGPPDVEFAKEINAPWYLKFIIKMISAGIRKKAKIKNVNYSFLFMKSNGQQLNEITKLIESGSIRPVIDRVFEFEQANDALAYVETGRAKGKVVIRVK